MRSPFLYAEDLMKTIDELWYGNISPFEQCTRGDERLKELLKLVARNREELVLSSIFRKFVSGKMKLCAEARQWSGYAPLI